ncbi:haloacid dehalogenase [Xylariaceae sp. FL0804]|nr:haloacid dehalogenase [Xylariaceae sp. FL0804]
MASDEHEKKKDEKKIVIAFDLYGTLLSTESIADELGEIYGEDRAGPLAALWRQYQLEYTWRLNSMGEYKTFSAVTRSALSHAVAERGPGPLRPPDADRLMRSYDALRAFPEVPAALELLLPFREKKKTTTTSGTVVEVEACIFSNGTDEMLTSSIRSSPDLSSAFFLPSNKLLRPLVVSVHSLRCFKPDPRTYAHLREATGCSCTGGGGGGGDDLLWVVSANPFDIAGARAAGLNAAFIDRAGRGWVDRLDETREPAIVAGGVDEAVRRILDY